MRRAIVTIIFLVVALFLPYWVWVPAGILISIYFQWYLEAPAIAVILEAATMGDGSGTSNLPISVGLIVIVGFIELARPRLVERQERITL